MLPLKIMDKGVELLRHLVEDNSAIVVPEDKVYLFENRLGELLKHYQVHSHGELYHLAISNRQVLDKIVDLMSTKETMWFRDAHIWDLLEKDIFPIYFERARRARNEKMRIWCSACSTGQEPYSLAMQIDSLLLRYPGVGVDQFEIIATDIAQSAIKAAKDGVFNKVEMARGLRGDYLRRYFHETEKGWEIADKLKSMVSFKVFNLQTPFYNLGKFDLILCRNVAIYFSDAFKLELFRKCANVLQPDGCFFVGASESLHAYGHIFKKVQVNKVIYYQHADVK